VSTSINLPVNDDRIEYFMLEVWNKLFLPLLFLVLVILFIIFFYCAYKLLAMSRLFGGIGHRVKRALSDGGSSKWAPPRY
jgi:hypothetical protein